MKTDNECCSIVDGTPVFMCSTICAQLTNCRLKKGIRVKLHNENLTGGILELVRKEPLGFNYGVREDRDGKLYWHHLYIISKSL